MRILNTYLFVLLLNCFFSFCVWASEPYSGYPVHQAIAENNCKYVREYIKNGGSPNLQTDGGVTLLHAAVIYDNLKLVKYLLERGANPNLKDFKYGTTPINTSVANSLDDNISVSFEIIELLISKGANVNNHDKIHGTSLFSHLVTEACVYPRFFSSEYEVKIRDIFDKSDFRVTPADYQRLDAAYLSEENKDCASFFRNIIEKNRY
ncbi:MAG: ankyrin repeat domain-containing protein [Alphaproteobacteria bacterium]|nr:ankyrin repeat domain-containing protein [Alphaproteobacteria bacterium]